jgi:hypothetical protein
VLQQDTSKPAKGKKGNKKGKRGREPTIVIVFFHRTTIDGESSQKLNKIGETFSSRCGVYLAISRKDKSIKQKTKAGESEEKDKTFSAMWKKTKVFSKSSPLLNTLLLVLRRLAVFLWTMDTSNNTLSEEAGCHIKPPNKAIVPHQDPTVLDQEGRSARLQYG